MRFIPDHGPERDAAEVFWVGPCAYDISRARQLIAATPRPPQQLDLHLAQVVIAAGEVNVDPRRVWRVDLTEPGIAIPSPVGPVLIDGWHRAARTIAEGRPTMCAYILTADEVCLIRGQLREAGPRSATS